MASFFKIFYMQYSLNDDNLNTYSILITLVVTKNIKWLSSILIFHMMSITLHGGHI